MPSSRITYKGNPNKADRFRAIVQTVLAQEAKAVKREYEITVKTWKRKPVFTITNKGGGRYDVKTDSKIYGYVDYGTRPHIIRPRRAKALRFFGVGFVSKTVPGKLYPRAGRAASSGLQFRQFVRHPGFPGRGFTEMIAKRSRARLKRELQKALKALT
jgi:hypothetical protein